MQTGMLWFDNRKIDAGVKALTAAEYFRKKYGRWPNAVAFNANEYPSLNEICAGDCDILAVKHFRWVMPSHLWIGVEEKAGV